MCVRTMVMPVASQSYRRSRSRWHRSRFRPSLRQRSRPASRIAVFCPVFLYRLRIGSQPVAAAEVVPNIAMTILIMVKKGSEMTPMVFSISRKAAGWISYLPISSGRVTTGRPIQCGHDRLAGCISGICVSRCRQSGKNPHFCRIG
jgi:hypothetical protein